MIDGRWALGDDDGSMIICGGGEKAADDAGGNDYWERRQRRLGMAVAAGESRGRRRLERARIASNGVFYFM